MIYQNDTFENTENLFADAVKDLQISKLLHKSNVRKSCGVPASAGFSGKKPLPIPEFQTQGTCCLKKHEYSGPL